MSDSKTFVYFPGLNTLRFVAAFLVFLSHVEQFKGLFGFDHFYHIQAVHQVGNLAVTFFFVLSGFLITYLLFKERDVSSTISIKNFYVRRFLRIWPLYYLLVLLGLFFLPNFEGLYYASGLSELYDNFSAKIILYLIFLPQVVLITFPRVLYLEPSWSIGIEEQFYLFWPILMKFFKNFVKLSIGVIIFIYGLRFISFFTLRMSDNELLISTASFIRDYFYFARFQAMMIGAIGSYILYQNKTAILNIIYNPFVQFLTWSATILCLVTGFNIIRVTHDFYAVLFIVLILNVASNKNSWINLENKTFNYLGKISYGIYMYHEIAIGLIIYIMTKQLNIQIESGIGFILLYLFSLALTITISSASYHFFESLFLKFKGRFTAVKSGDAVTEKLK